MGRIADWINYILRILLFIVKFEKCDVFDVLESGLDEIMYLVIVR